MLARRRLESQEKALNETIAFIAHARDLKLSQTSKTLGVKLVRQQAAFEDTRKYVAELEKASGSLPLK